MDLKLKGKVAVITGGTRGIGFAIAKSLAAEGAIPLVTFSSNKEAAEKAVNELKKTNPKSESFQFNVGNVDEVCTSFKEILDKHGKVDILVNNAGITKDNLLARMTESDWDDVINVNLKSVYACSKMVILSMMKQRWGRIINISSVVAESGNPGQVNYTASKGGMISFTKTLAKEVGSRFITVNAITPGYIQTEMTAGLPEKVKQAMFDQIPLGHFGEPEDVGSLVSFLASDNGSYITGQVIGINGGLYV